MGRRLARRRADARAKGAAACTCRMLSERRARSAVGGEKTALWSTLQAGPRKVPVRWQVAVRSPGVAGRLLRRSSPLDAGTHERRGRAHPADERGWAGGSEGKGRRIWIWYMWGVLRSLVHGRRGFACGRPPTRTGRTAPRTLHDHLHDSPRRTGRASVCAVWAVPVRGSCTGLSIGSARTPQSASRMIGECLLETIGDRGCDARRSVRCVIIHI